MGATALFVGAFAILASLALVLLAILPRGASQKAETTRPKREKGDRKDAVERTSQYLVSRTEGYLKESSRSPISERELELAGLNTTPGQVVVTLGIVLFVLFFGIVALTGQLILAILACAVVLVGAKTFVSFKIERRRKAFADELEDALQIIAAALRAGLSFPAAVDSVAQNSPDPMGTEFGRIINENRIGRDIVEAMSQTAVRMESEDFRWITEAVATHRETGGNLNQIIGQVATTIRERKELRQEVESLAAEGKYSGIVLMLLPIVVAGMVSVFNPGYIQPLFVTTTGQFVLAGSFVLYVIGGFWIRKIVSVDF